MPKPEFQSQFSMSKIISIFLIIFSFYQCQSRNSCLLLTFFDNFNFWNNLNDDLFESQPRSNQNNILLETIFEQKSSFILPLSSKLLHWADKCIKMSYNFTYCLGPISSMIVFFNFTMIGKVMVSFTIVVKINWSFFYYFWENI